MSPCTIDRRKSFPSLLNSNLRLAIFFFFYALRSDTTLKQSHQARLQSFGCTAFGGKTEKCLVAKIPSSRSGYKNFSGRKCKVNLCVFMRVPGGQNSAKIHCVFACTLLFQRWTIFATSMSNTSSSQSRNLIVRSANYLKAIIQIKMV